MDRLAYLALYGFIQPLCRIQHKWSTTGLNTEFSFSWIGCHSKVKEPALSYHLPIAGFIPFPRVLALYEIQTASSRIWTQVAGSIFYDDNYITTSTSSFVGRQTNLGEGKIINSNFQPMFQYDSVTCCVESSQGWVAI